MADSASSDLARSGVRLAVDVGSVRVGVAASDPDGRIALPVTVLARDRRGDTDLRRLAELAGERAAFEVIVGWPRSLSGADGRAATTARRFATRLAAAVAPIEVRLVDERLSTIEAGRRLQAAGRDTRSARSVVDAAAAVVILEAALAEEQRTGLPAGELVSAAGGGSGVRGPG